jgi:hypothetical protein
MIQHKNVRVLALDTAPENPTGARAAMKPPDVGRNIKQ